MWHPRLYEALRNRWMRLHASKREKKAHINFSSIRQNCAETPELMFRRIMLAEIHAAGGGAGLKVSPSRLCQMTWIWRPVVWGGQERGGFFYRAKDPKQLADRTHVLLCDLFKHVLCDISKHFQMTQSKSHQLTKSIMQVGWLQRVQGIIWAVAMQSWNVILISSQLFLS